MLHLSKSRYLEGLQCPKLLWFSVNARDRMPPVPPGQQAIFDQGHAVGSLAKTMFPKGIEIEASFRDIDGALRKTAELLPLCRPLFEAAFMFNGGFARADILIPVEDNAWDIAEVKSSSEINEINRRDLAFQRYVYEGAGLRIRRAFLYHVNTGYVRRGAVDPQEFLVKSDITDEIQPLLRDIPRHLEEFRSVVMQGQAPEVRIGPHCSKPYACRMKEVCWAFLPKHSLTTLTRIGTKGFEAMERYGAGIGDLPDDYALTENQRIQAKAVKSGTVHVDRESIGRFLSRLEYPLSFLDFETMQSAIPPFDGSRPYQQIPFQFSLHVVAAHGALPHHHAFLAEGRDDPRPKLLAKLKSVIGSSGSIVAYNASFEAGRLREMAETFPANADWAASLESRFVDLYEPFRQFAWYHPDQKGSASMKDVLPALTGRSYAGMPIADGTTAANEYVRVTFGDVSDDERTKVREDLLRYCGLDAEGMQWIVEELRRLAGVDQ